MCNSCQLLHDPRHSRSVRGRSRNLLAVGLLLAAGAASAALGAASLLGSQGRQAAAAPPAAAVLELRGRDLRSGRPLAEALRGRPVVVGFWSAACPACRRAAASLQGLAAANPAAVLVGIDVGDSTTSARGFFRRLRWQQLSAADPAGHYSEAVGLRALPTTLLLDPEHRIVARADGVDGLATLERRLR